MGALLLGTPIYLSQRNLSMPTVLPPPKNTLLLHSSPRESTPSWEGGGLEIVDPFNLRIDLTILLEQAWSERISSIPLTLPSRQSDSHAPAFLTYNLVFLY